MSCSRQLIAVTLAVVLGLACQPQKEPEPQQNLPPKPMPMRFVPPSDTVVSASQFSAWLACNPFLDSLASRYRDSLVTEEPEKRLAYEKAFRHAQVEICRLNGLSGGYEEYLWILQHLYSPRNRHFLDSTGLGR